MALFDDLIQGSFKGVEFHIESSNHTGGREIVAHKYINRTDSVLEDTSNKTKTFQIVCFIFGENYLLRKQNLINVLNEPGAGELSHPYYGKMTARNSFYSVVEKKERGGYCKFRIDFILEVEQNFPQRVQDDVSPINNVAASAENSLQVAVTAQDESLSGKSLRIAGASANTLRQTASKVSALSGELRAEVFKYTSPVNEVSNGLTVLTQNSAALIKEPQRLFEVAQGSFNGLVETAQDTRTTLDAMNSYINKNFRRISASGNSSDDLIIANNEEASRQAFVGLAITTSAKALVLADFLTRAEVTVYIEQISKAIDDLLPILDDARYLTFKALRNEVYNYLTFGVFAELVTENLEATQPALIVAKNLFRDLGKEQELIEQNKIINPAFTPPGEVVARK